ncbi:hypothetical protein GGR57DRAFT_146115 [Xylariaceae sp. FL1272]|nr:hypothetical protein GGR57DRAFT_146115 [Xylariaceae sp. FL1272]
MALAALYSQFLAAPDASKLADNASLNYITTTTALTGALNIVQHLATTARQVKKKKESPLSLVHGESAIALEMDTTLEFVTSGASYLPALDDNFLADRTVSLPILHLVTFDQHTKIVNIRQSWDQGALLKQLDIIGKTGRNWPIRDSQDQIRMIENCVKSLAGDAAAPDSQQSMPDRSRAKSTDAMRDPHASLSLFEARDAQEELASVISPRGGVKPRQRDFAEILGDEPDEYIPGSPSAGRGRSDSPNKAIAPRGGAKPRQRDFAEILGDEPVSAQDAERKHSTSPGQSVAPKAGGSKKFQPSRLFDTEEGQIPSSPPDDIKSPDRFYRPHPTKYSHFEFGDGADPHDAPVPVNPTPRKTKHSSQWKFDDFVTPAKVQPGKAYRQQEVHWQTGEEDEPISYEPAQGKLRPDAEVHFEFADDGPSPAPADRHPVRPRGATHNSGLGLYENNLYDETGAAPDPTEASKPLGAITNLKDRGRYFDSQWAMTDIPSPEKPEGMASISDDRKKAVKMMESNWSANGDSGDSPVQKENKRAAPKYNEASNDRGIAIGGDGMGGNKGSSRNWIFGDDEDAEPPKSIPGRKPPAAKSGGFNWDF